ncbi:GIY-YIG nuclease family protein [Stella sp.]|uniref:GIY-YIG nuclease family protein n=1 Tax=Stella sp. TaxID=2912054 RepID=UPI0035B28FB2
MRCADGSCYVGLTRTTGAERLAQHEAGTFDGWTARRRPIALAFQEHCPNIVDAIAAERRIKARSRGKKEALVAGDWARLRELARGRDR